MFVQVKSVGGYNTAQIYTNGLGYDCISPMTRWKEVPPTLMSFIQDVGIPQELVSDNAPKQIHVDFCATCHCYHVKQRQVVPYSLWANLAESAICELKKGVRRTLHCSHAS